MKKNLLKILLFSLVLFVAIGLTYGETVLAETTTIRILRPGTQQQAQSFLEPAVEEFQDLNPDIIVAPQYMGWFSWIETYRTLFDAGDQPDIILWWDRNLREEGVAEHLVPLDDYVSQETLDRIPERLREHSQIDGKTMIIPSSTSSLLFMWRKDVFEEAGLDPDTPPATWDEVFEYAEQIQENTNVYPIGVTAAADETLVDLVSSIYFSMSGEQWLDEEYRPQFNNEAGLEALTVFQSLKEFAQPGAVTQSRGDVRAPFRDGHIAINFTDGAWFFPMLEERHGSDLGPIGVSKYPEGLAGPYSLAGLDGWVIANEANAEAAGEFLDFITSPEQQYRHTVEYGVAPMYDEELEMEGLQEEHWRIAKEARDDWSVQRLGTDHPAPTAAYDVAIDIFQRLWEEDITPQEALDLLEEGINSLNEDLGLY